MGMYVCVCMCVCMYVCVCVIFFCNCVCSTHTWIFRYLYLFKYKYIQSKILGSFLCCALRYLLGTVSHWTRSRKVRARLVGHLPFGIYVSLPLKCWTYRHTHSLTGPFRCVMVMGTQILATEPFSQLLLFFINGLSNYTLNIRNHSYYQS